VTVLSPEKARAQLVALDRYEAKQSLSNFVPLAWPELEPGREYVASWQVDAVCEHLEAVTYGWVNRLLINVPPGSMKSLLSSVMWPAWEWGPRDMGATRYLATAFNDGPVKRDTRKMRDLVMSPWYAARWPKIKLVRSGETSFANSLTGGREGVPFPSLTSQRGDRLIIDDPHSTTTAESETERKRTVRQFREGAVNRLNDQMKSAIIIIMQRLHEGDISGEVLANEMGYVHLCLPMEYEPAPYKIGKHVFDPKRKNEIGFVDPRTQAGELLNPGRFTAEAVAALKRDMGSYAFTGQYQQRPVPREGGLFKRHWFEGRIVGAAPPGTVWIRHWDMAATRGKGAYTAGVKLGRTPDGRYVVGHVERCQEEGDVVRRLIKAQGELDGYDTTISLAQDGGQAGKVQRQEMVAYLAGFTVRVLIEASLGDKENRATPFSVQCEAGNVSLVRGDWNEDYLSELCLFPGGKYKDQVDATSGAFAQHVMGPPQPIFGTQTGR
jgi:predicted phage terminase large subunit-like protein